MAGSGLRNDLCKSGLQHGVFSGLHTIPNRNYIDHHRPPYVMKLVRYPCQDCVNWKSQLYTVVLLTVPCCSQMTPTILWSIAMIALSIIKLTRIKNPLRKNDSYPNISKHTSVCFSCYITTRQKLLTTHPVSWFPMVSHELPHFPFGTSEAKTIRLGATVRPRVVPRKPTFPVTTKKHVAISKISNQN